MTEQHSDSIFSALADRIRSPLAGSFFLVWTITQWRGFVILFTFQGDALERVKLADASFSEYGWEKFWGALIVTILYVLIMPWIRTIYQKYCDKRNQYIELQKIQIALEQEQLRQYHATYKQIIESLLGERKSVSNGLSSFSKSMNDWTNRYPELKDLKRMAEELKKEFDSRDPILGGFQENLELKPDHIILSAYKRIYTQLESVKKAKQ